MLKEKLVSNKVFDEIVNFDPTLCLYLDLVTYKIKPKDLGKKTQVLVEKIIKEDKRIKKVATAIENLSEHYLVKTVHEFLRIYMFDDFCKKIRKSIWKTIDKDNASNLNEYISKKCDDKHEYWINYHLKKGSEMSFFDKEGRFVVMTKGSIIAFKDFSKNL